MTQQQSMNVYFDKKGKLRHINYPVKKALSLHSQDLKRKIEEMKITKKKMKSDDDLIVKRFVNGGKDLKDPAVARSRSNASNKSNGYNQALDDVLALWKEE